MERVCPSPPFLSRLSLFPSSIHSPGLFPSLRVYIFLLVFLFLFFLSPSPTSFFPDPFSFSFLLLSHFPSLTFCLCLLLFYFYHSLYFSPRFLHSFTLFLSPSLPFIHSPLSSIIPLLSSFPPSSPPLLFSHYYPFSFSFCVSIFSSFLFFFFVFSLSPKMLSILFLLLCLHFFLCSYFLLRLLLVRR